MEWLFCHGSNNINQLMEILEKDEIEFASAYAKHWQRVFRGYSKFWRSGVSTIIKNKGAYVFGICVKVTRFDLSLLDFNEDANPDDCFDSKYGLRKREKVKVNLVLGDNNFKEVMAWAYISNSKKFSRPSEKYLKEVVRTINQGQWTMINGKKVTVKDIPIR